MPELPEVEVVRRGLDRWVTGRTIAEVEVHHPRAVRRHLEGAEHFVAALTGSTLTAAHRRGKQVHVWTVDDPEEMRELLDRGVDGLFTDRTDLLKDVLAERDQWKDVP